jgi:hypothetical protein
VSLAVGILPSEVAELGASDYDLLRRYWYEEPWGAYRDNLHTAIVAREIRRTAYKGDHKLADFLLQRPERREAEQRSGVFNMFRALAHKVKRK